MESKMMKIIENEELDDWFKFVQLKAELTSMLLRIEELSKEKLAKVERTKSLTESIYRLRMKHKDWKLDNEDLRKQYEKIRRGFGW